MRKVPSSKVLTTLILVALLIWGRFFFRLWHDPKPSVPKLTKEIAGHLPLLTIPSPLSIKPLPAFTWDPFRQKDLRPKPKPTNPTPILEPPPAPSFPWQYAGCFQRHENTVYLFIWNDTLSHLVKGDALGPWVLVDLNEEIFTFQASPDHQKVVAR